MKIEPLSEDEIKELVKLMGWDNNYKRLLYTLANERAERKRQSFWRNRLSVGGGES